MEPGIKYESARLHNSETFQKVRAALDVDHGVGDTYNRCSSCGCGDIRNFRFNIDQKDLQQPQ